MNVSWSITLLLVNLIAFAACMVLWRTAPCWMQRLTVATFAASLAIMSLGRFIALVSAIRPEWGWYGASEMTLLALAVQHLAVLLYVFRLVFRELLWVKSSDKSRLSLGW
jgi:hypothetical protein